MLEANCPRLLFPLVRGHSGHSRNHDAGRDQRVFTNHDGGTPMASREINLINSAVATAAMMPRITSNVVAARRRKGIFTGRSGLCRGIGKAVLDELRGSGAARVPREFSRAGAPDAVEDPSPLFRFEG